jgi:hypothetical protein
MINASGAGRKSMSNNTPRPIELAAVAGKWIALDFDESRIIASGNSYEETRRAAIVTGEKRPVLVKTPDTIKRFIGGHR